jgi:hypothetical protein
MMATRARYQFADLVIESSRPLPELGAATPPPEVAVLWPDGIATGDVRWFHAWPTPDGDTWVRFGRHASGFVLEFPDRARFAIAADGSHIDVAPLGTAPVETLRHLLLNQVLPLVLSRRGRLVIHASAVAIDGAVVAFVGRTGVGKSTLAAACCSAGARLVTDDALVLVAAPDQTRWLAVPSYSSLRLWAAATALLGWPTAGDPASHYSPKLRFGPEHGRIEFETASRPLARIIVVENPGTRVVRAEPLTGHRAVLSIATHLFRLDIEDASETVHLFDALSRVTPTIDVERFEADRPTESGALILPRVFAAHG